MRHVVLHPRKCQLSFFSLLLLLVAFPAALPAAHGDISLNWDDNSEPDLSHYNLYRAQTTGGPYQQVNTEPVLASQFVDSGLTPGVTYFYVVTAVDGSGNESAHSNEAATQPADLEPPVFSALTVAPALATAGTQVTLTFTVSKALAQAPAVLVNGHGATLIDADGFDYTFTYVVGATDANGAARIDLAALDTAGNTGSLTDSALLTVDKTAPVISDLAVSPARVRAGDDARVTFQVSKTPATAPVVTINGRGATAHSVADNTYTYYYTIQNNDTEGAATVVVSLADSAGNTAQATRTDLLILDLTAPARPEGVTVTVGDGNLTLTWQPVQATDLAGYQVAMATTPGGPYQTVSGEGLLSETTLTIPGLENGVTRYFVVTAVDTVGNASPQSAEVSGTPRDLTPPAPPRNVRAVALPNG